MLYTRHDDSWTLHEFKEARDEISLRALDISLPLSEIYSDVAFERDT
jgi:hypothetical protein